MRYDSLRIFLAVVTKKDLKILQLDVQTAFSYDELEEDIHMKIPEGLKIEETSSINLACKLKKSLYGLKQAPRCWNKKFNQFLRQCNFKCSETDYCIFSGRVNEETIYLVLFIDDGLVAAKSELILNLVANYLRETFKIKIGDSSLLVGLQIERDKETSKHIDRSSYNIVSCREKGDKISNTVPYREAIEGH